MRVSVLSIINATLSLSIFHNPYSSLCNCPLCTAPRRSAQGRSKGGGNKDPIWRLFRRVSNAAGILKAECALCSHQQAPVAKRLKRHMLHTHPGLLAPGLLDPKPLARAAAYAADADANDDDLDEQDDEDGFGVGDGDSDYAPDVAHELSAQARRQCTRHLLQLATQQVVSALASVPRRVPDVARRALLGRARAARRRCSRRLS